LLRCWMMQGWEGGFYYGPDSSTYWEAVFRHHEGERFYVSDKRPKLYSRLMCITSWGPKSPAYTAALIQHAIGLLTVIPLAAIMQMCLVRWRWWVIPTTLLYGCHPQLLYWEHVLIADSIFIAVALVSVWAVLRLWCEPRKWTLLGLALACIFVSMNVRPVGRALWLSLMPVVMLLPGLSWKDRGWRLLLVLALYPVASRLTKVNQAEALMFASVFPLVVLDKPPYPELKAEFAPAVLEDRSNLWRYISTTQGDRWRWMDASRAENVGPAYTALVDNSPQRVKVTAELTHQAILHNPFTYAWMIAMKTYHLCALNTKAGRLDPDQYQSGDVKFLTTSLKKVDPRFPSYLLNDGRATTADGIATAVDDELRNTAAQERVLKWQPLLTKLTSLFVLPERSPTIPAPQHALPLALFLIGMVSWPFLPKGRNFIPLIFLGVGYIILTLLVGRAVERYRLPAEYLLLLGVVLGVDGIYAALRYALYDRWRRPVSVPNPSAGV